MRLLHLKVLPYGASYAWKQRVHFHISWIYANVFRNIVSAPNSFFIEFSCPRFDSRSLNFFILKQPIYPENNDSGPYQRGHSSRSYSAAPHLALYKPFSFLGYARQSPEDLESSTLAAQISKEKQICAIIHSRKHANYTKLLFLATPSAEPA